MAGDWLKVDISTPEKPEVLELTSKLGWDDPDVTVGKLFRFWRWFDQHTIGGNAPGVTFALLDRIVGVTGFSEKVQEVGWLLVTENGVSLPNFERHNGESAKERALAAKRAASHRVRSKSNANSNASTVTKSVTSALPREEKRREEINTPNEDQIRKVASVYPKIGNSQFLDRIVAEEIGKAIERDGFERVVSETACRVRGQDTRFLPSPEKFFRTSEYLVKLNRQADTMGADYVPESQKRRQELAARKANA